MRPTAYELQLAAVLASTLDDEGGVMEADELVGMAQALAPLIEDAADYYLRCGVAPEITDPAAT